MKNVEVKNMEEHSGTMTDVVVAARVIRGSTVEAIHYASVAVVDSKGNVTHSLGNPDMVSMTRSSIKPFQALAVVRSGAADHFGFSPKQLAIMCGSHNGDDIHRENVISILDAADNRSESLLCGQHWPTGMKLKAEYPLAGEDKDSLRHNCSGKHSGFLALAKFLSEPLEEYLSLESKTQRMIKQNLSQYFEYPEEKMSPGIDGCSAPNYPLPLSKLALGFCKLASAGSGDSDIDRAAGKLRDAMWQYPEMVSGEGRFDLDLARSFPNNVVCKVGAESMEGIGFAEPAIGIAVKVHDGNQRALGAICVSVLRQLGLIENDKQYPLLQRYFEPEIKNYRKITTGKIVCDFTLTEV